MNINLNTEKTIVIRPVETRTVSTISIERIVDIPAEQSVYVFLGELGRVKLDALSDANYNNPPWSDQMVIDAATAYVNSVSQ